MSLINEALKKAQRVRNQEETDLAPTPGGTVFPRVARRGQPRSAKSLILIATGAVVLFVLSVVATVYVINRPDPVHSRHHHRQSCCTGHRRGAGAKPHHRATGDQAPGVHTRDDPGGRRRARFSRACHTTAGNCSDAHAQNNDRRKARRARSRLRG